MTQTRDAELLPCPFCGGEAYTWGNTACEWRVECKSCGASSLPHVTPREAAAAWNRRHFNSVLLVGDMLYFGELGTFRRVANERESM